MDALTGAVAVDPTDPRILPLVERHLGLMRATSPACSVHAMEASDLAASGAYFVAILDTDQAVAMGALKPLSAVAGELKSMHVAEERRGGGLADAILAALEAAARVTGLSRLYLETGSRDAFAPARAFYRRNGFTECPPFDGYDEDPESVFFAKDL